MILLRLKVTNKLGEGNKPVQVTTAMLDVIPSPNTVRFNISHSSLGCNTNKYVASTKSVWWLT